MDKTIPPSKKIIKILNPQCLKLNKFLVASIILSIAFGQFTRVGLGWLPDFYIHDMLVVILLAVNINLIIKPQANTTTKYIYYFIAALTLSYLVNIPVYPCANSLINFLYSARISAYLLTYTVVARLEFSAKKIKQLLLLSGVIIAIIGLAQYFLHPDTRYLYYLGWDDHLNRLIFPYFDPAYTGVMTSLTLLYSISEKYYPVAFLSLGATLLTYARSIFLSLAPAIILQAKKTRLWLLVGIILGVIILPTRFGEGTNLLRTYSISSRFTHDMKIIPLALKNPIFGIGMNNLSHEISTESEFTNRATTANNSFIYLAVTTGALGTLLFLLILYQLIKNSENKSLWAFLITASLFNNVLFYPFALLWILILESTSKKVTSSTKE